MAHAKTKMDIEAVIIESPNIDVDIIGEALIALDLTPASYTDLETGKTTTYLVNETRAEADALAARLATAFEEWKPLLSAMPAISVKSIKQEDWSQTWKKNFHTFRASRRLVVKPSWEEYDAQPDDLVLPIDPGMCFGTGYHGTTRACLTFLDKLQEKHGKMSFIDAGTGSGILSIGARLLGYSPVEAFDNDPQCIPTALENLELAGFKDVKVTCAPLGGFKPTHPADVVAANILAVVLMKQTEDVIALARPGGYLILSGILIEQYDALRKAFTDKGCIEIEQTTLNEWRSGLFTRP